MDSANRQNNLNKELYSNGVGNGLAHSIQVWLNRSLKVLIWFGGIFIAIVMMITVSDVSGRKFFDSPIRGTSDIVEAALVFIATIGMITVTYRGKNVGVSIFTSHFPKRIQKFLVSLGQLVGFAVLSVTSWQLWLSATGWAQRGIVTGVLHIPFASLKYAFAVGAGLLALVLLKNFIQSLFQKYVQTEAEPHG